MAIDYERLVTGLGQFAAATGDGSGPLAMIDGLVDVVAEATGAIGATYTEYGSDGGRVLVARGAVSFALGQPVGAELVRPEQVGQAWAGRVDALPRMVAEPLLSRGVVAMAGQQMVVGDRVAGALHVYFDQVAQDCWPALAVALRMAGACAAGVCAGRAQGPSTPTSDEDDRSLFLAMAGHELRTPVTVIKGYASLLDDRWDGLGEADRRAAVQVIHHRSRDLAQLVDRLLGASTGDSGSGLLVRTIPFDLGQVLHRTANQMSDELRRAVRMQVVDGLPPALGDPVVLGSVVVELVTNAVRSAGAGVSPQLSSVDVVAGADADTVYVQVRDRGVGIDPAHTERAFERFWRDRRMDESRGGIGLGLHLVRRLVERQNGWVSLRPRDGGGTIAEVRLSRADTPPRSGEA